MHDHPHHRHDHGDEHHHHHGHGHHRHHHEHDHGHAHGRPGHNRPASPAQWQTPHRPAGEPVPPEPALQDLDLVEASFVEGFLAASDPTSFLRLAGIPFVASGPDGQALYLLRCEIEDRTDVGAVSPLMGGQGLRYDPLPKAFVSRRRRLAFAYHDGSAVLRLDFAAARALTPAAEGLALRLSGAGASRA